MLKKILSLTLVLCLLMPVCAALADTYATVKESAEIQTGPGRAYVEPGYRLPYGTSVKAISRVWDDYDGVWYVLCEFQWGYDLCRAYIVNRRMNINLSSVPVETAPLQSCTVIRDADVFAGPGITYTLWNDTVWSGTSATLLAVENGYGFIECWNSYKQQTWRVWVDLDYLSCGSQYSGSVSRPSYYRYLPAVPAGGITPTCGNKASIMWVQQCLRSCGYGELAVDGKWGQQTQTAVLAFQRDHGFTRNGSLVTYEMACTMLDMFYSRGMPLRYLEHYLPD